MSISSPDSPDDRFGGIAFCGGGSGGHLTPAIAVAEELLQQQPGLRLCFFTSDRDVDRRILVSSGLVQLPNVCVVPLPIQSGLALRRHPLRYLKSLLKSVQICRQQLIRNRCRFALGLGGFVSVPGIAAACSRRLPVAILELNRCPGRANRLLAYCCRQVLTGWPPVPGSGRRWTSGLRSVGVPLRRDFLADLNPIADCDLSSAAAVSSAAPVSGSEPAPGGPPCLLIIGGSQGAGRLNQLLLQSVSAVPADWNIVHQTGSREFAAVTAEYGRQLPPAVDATGGIQTAADIAAAFEAVRFDSGRVSVVPFIDNVAAALRSATVVISRAGAVSLAEIAAAGKASVLVPLSTATDQHQQANADYFAGQGAAVCLDETSSTAAQQLAEHLNRLTADAEFRTQLQTAARQLACPGAAAEVARQILIRMVDTTADFRADPRHGKNTQT